VHLTMTDDHPWAQAFVIIEAIPLISPDTSLDMNR
jgi:holo-[acyl-carrier protein] synthase